ncbi:MAG: DUF1499 domain-containing protein [Desulfovibrionaceae bacterium]
MSEIMDRRPSRPSAGVCWREYVIRPVPWRRGVSSLGGAGGCMARPLAYAGNHARAMNVLVLVVDGLPRSGILDRAGDGLRAVFKSRFFGFPDEAVFWQDRQARRIHVWSAARYGLWDMGTNRRRVELIRERFHQAMAGGA